MTQTIAPSRIPRAVLLMFAAAGTSSCSGVQDMMAPAGPAAQRIAALGWFVLVIFIAVTIVMWGLVFWLAWRRRGTLDSHLPIDAPQDQRWVLVGGFAIPVVILAIIFVVMLRSMSAFPMGGEMTGHGTTGGDVRVIAHQWWWEVHYLSTTTSDIAVSANEIHVPVGTPVDIQLESQDVIHSFWVPRLHGKVDLIPQVVNRIRIQADQAGIYRGQCAEFCGPQHAHMIFEVVAHEPAEYQAWLRQEQQLAAAPLDDETRRGQQVFMANACVLCHTIRGTDAHGQIGPDLTHFGRRLGVAANTMPNDIASLAAWVTHAQSLKPDARMPTITAFNGRDLRALTDYLRSLR